MRDQKALRHRAGLDEPMGRLLLAASLFLLAVAGLCFGSWLANKLSLFTEGQVIATLFSGVPTRGMGFLGCFAAFLLNALVFLTFLFLFGAAAFGVAVIPAVVLVKGVFVGLAVSGYLIQEGSGGLFRAMLVFCPAAAISLLTVLFFSARSFRFSNRLRKAAFSSSGQSPDFPGYAGEYVRFLCFSVAASLICAAVAVIGT